MIEMFDEYGNHKEYVYLVDAEIVRYSNCTGIFKDYYVATIEGFQGPIRSNWDVKNAERFAEKNGLTIITKSELYAKMDENSKNKSWPEKG